MAIEDKICFPFKSILEVGETKIGGKSYRWRAKASFHRFSLSHHDTDGTAVAIPQDMRVEFTIIVSTSSA